MLIGPYMTHRDVAAIGKPTSAGFCSIVVVESPPDHITTTYYKVHCWGRSTSLGLDSIPESDARLIEKLFNAC